MASSGSNTHAETGIPGTPLGRLDTGSAERVIMGMTGNQWIGMSVYFVGCVFYAIGPNLKKWAEERGIVTIEVISMVIYMGSGALWAISLGMGTPLTWASPLLATAVVMNQLLARFMNKEVIRRLDIVGGSLIVISVVLMSSFAPIDAISDPANHYDCITAKSTEDYINSNVLQTWGCLIYSLVVSGAIIFCFIINQCLRFRAESYELRGCCLDMYRVSFGVLAGLFGGSLNIYMQQMSWTILGTITCPWPYLLEDYWIYALILVVIVFEIGQLWWVNAGLKVADAKLVATLEIVTNQYASEAGGLIVMKGYQGFPNTWHMGVYIVSVIIGLLGCCVLVSASSARNLRESLTLVRSHSRYVLHQPEHSMASSSQVRGSNATYPSIDIADVGGASNRQEPEPDPAIFSLAGNDPAASSCERVCSCCQPPRIMHSTNSLHTPTRYSLTSSVVPSPAQALP